MTLAQRVAAIYEELRMDVYRYVLTLGVAPDTAQEIFLRLLETMRKGIAVEHARAWLLTVAHNLAMNLFKARAPRAEDFGAQDRNPLGAEERMIEEERRGRLRKEVARLSRQQQAWSCGRRGCGIARSEKCWASAPRMWASFCGGRWSI